MTTTERDLARVLIRTHEGLRLVAYDCGTGKPLRQGSTIVGHPTIGWGRNLAGRGISRSEADLLLERDLDCSIQDAQAWLGGAGWTGLAPPRRAALIDFIYNVGPGTAADFLLLRAAIERGDFKTASAALLQSKYAKQVGQRARTLAAILRTGEPLGE